MIDYLGFTSAARLPHGVGYDDVPYGVRPQPPSPPLDASTSVSLILAETARDNRAPANRRLAALASLRTTGHPQPDAILQAVASDPAAPPNVRQLAAANLIEVNPGRGAEAVLGLIQRRDPGADALAAAVIDTAALVHHGKVPANVAERVHHLLVGVASWDSQRLRLQVWGAIRARKLPGSDHAPSGPPGSSLLSILARAVSRTGLS